MKFKTIIKMEKTNIDYMNIFNHTQTFESTEDRKKYIIVDANRDAGAVKKEDIIIELTIDIEDGFTDEELEKARGEHFCAWRTKTRNTVKVKDWFRKKYTM